MIFLLPIRSATINPNPRSLVGVLDSYTLPRPLARWMSLPFLQRTRRTHLQRCLLEKGPLKLPQKLPMDTRWCAWRDKSAKLSGLTDWTGKSVKGLSKYGNSCTPASPRIVRARLPQDPTRIFHWWYLATSISFSWSAARCCEGKDKTETSDLRMSFHGRILQYETGSSNTLEFIHKFTLSQIRGILK